MGEQKRKENGSGSDESMVRDLMVMDVISEI